MNKLYDYFLSFGKTRKSACFSCYENTTPVILNVLSSFLLLTRLIRKFWNQLLTMYYTSIVRFYPLKTKIRTWMVQTFFNFFYSFFELIARYVYGYVHRLWRSRVSCRSVAVLTFLFWKIFLKNVYGWFYKTINFVVPAEYLINHQSWNDCFSFIIKNLIFSTWTILWIILIVLLQKGQLSMIVFVPSRVFNNMISFHSFCSAAWFKLILEDDCIIILGIHWQY